MDIEDTSGIPTEFSEEEMQASAMPGTPEAARRRVSIGMQLRNQEARVAELRKAVPPAATPLTPDEDQELMMERGRLGLRTVLPERLQDLERRRVAASQNPQAHAEFQAALAQRNQLVRTFRYWDALHTEQVAKALASDEAASKIRAAAKAEAAAVAEHDTKIRDLEGRSVTQWHAEYDKQGKRIS